jgi:hypothetical protein
LNAACKVIQERLGIKHGDLAGQFFDGNPNNKIEYRKIMGRYIQEEIDSMESEFENKGIAGPS